MDPKSISRVYSTMVLKAVDEDKREISGIASTPGTDRMGDVVEPAGAEFKLPVPLLWQHDHSQPIGNVIAAKVTAKGIEIRASLVKPTADMPSQLVARLEEAWQSIKTGLVRGLSIGFSPLEYAFMEDGIRFLRWNWHELSAVTVPANAEASITSIKSLDTALRASSGTPQGSEEGGQPAAPPGVSGTKKQPATGGFFYARTKGNEMNVQEQIKALEDKRKQLVDDRAAIQKGAVEAGRTKDASEQEKFAELTAEIDAIDKELPDLRVLEKDLAATAKPVEGQTEKGASDSRGTAPVSVKDTTKLEPGIAFARYAICLAKGQGNIMQSAEIAKSLYPKDERLNLRLKAAVEAGTTLDATYAAPLVRAENFEGDFIEFLRPQTIIGKFGTDGVPSLRRIPFNVRIVGQTSGGQGYWVGEGAPKPLTAFDFNAVELRWAKVANIAVLTEELIRFSNPSAEALVRQALADALIARLDIDFIDPGKAAVANVSPASITNGVTPVVSSGTDAEAVRADLRALWAGYIANNINPTGAVYIMSATTALALSLMQNPLGQSEFPGVTMRGGTLLGVPVIVSEYVAGDSSGGMVILANTSDIYLADDGGVAISASREASLQMLDNPTNNSATATATSLVSMFQTNSVAMRAERYINWAKRRPQAVAYLTGVNWA